MPLVGMVYMHVPTPHEVISSVSVSETLFLVGKGLKQIINPLVHAGTVTMTAYMHKGG